MPTSINPFVNSPSPTLLFFISCFSFILLSNSSLRLLLPWESEMRLLSPWFLKESWRFLVACIRKGRLGIFPLKKITISSKAVNAEEGILQEDVSLLDLPELALERILQRLSPSGLCSMAGLCTSLRDRCGSDHLWEKHMKRNGGRVIGPAAYQEWQWCIASRKRPNLLKAKHKKGFLRSLFSVCSLSRIIPKLGSSGEPRCVHYLLIQSRLGISPLRAASTGSQLRSITVRMGIGFVMSC